MRGCYNLLFYSVTCNLIQDVLVIGSTSHYKNRSITCYTSMATRIIEPMVVEKGVEDWLERIDQAIQCACTQDKVTGDDNIEKYSVSLLLSNIGPAG